VNVAGRAIPSAVQPAPLDLGPADRAIERRISALILVATPILFLLFLAIAPVAAPTFDDAKYVGIGRNFLAGNGPATVFGPVFLKHSPLWPMIIVIPERLVGIHPLVVGHLINALSASLTILLVGWLGWRVRPAVGAIAAVLLAALPYFFDIARTGGIDLPSIALTLAYVALGPGIVRTGSVRRAALLGAIFAVAFLIKETILPFAVVPFIVAILSGVSWRAIVRTAGVTLGVASLGMSWWFAMYAGYTHVVYRADLPAWTLLPSALAIVVFVALGLAVDRIADASQRRGWDAAATRRIPARLRSRTTIGWAAVLAWIAATTVLFGRTPKLLGASLLDPGQIGYMIRTLLASVRLAAAFGLGGLIVIVELIRARDRVPAAARDVLVATLCGIPLVLLVFGVGETPRHYIAELALVLLLATIGWYLGLARILERNPAGSLLTAVLAGLAVLIVGLLAIGRFDVRLVALGVVGGVVGLIVAALIVRWLAGHDRLGLIGVIVASGLFVAGLGVVGVRAVRAPAHGDASQAQATADTVAWIAATLPPGTTVAFGSYLSMETSIDLPAGYRAIQVRQYLAIGDPTAPLGLRSDRGTKTDYIAVDVAPLKANQFDVFAASQLVGQLRAGDARYYVFPVSRRLTSASVLAVLTPANGFTELPVRTYRGSDDTIDVHTYRIDPAALAVSADRMYISVPALERLVERLEAEPTAGGPAAANLLDRIVAPTDGSETALLARMARLAGR